MLALAQSLAKRNLLILLPSMLLFAGAALAQTSAIEGDIKDEDGKPMDGVKSKARILIDRKDIKGHWELKSKDIKKGHYFHAGLPAGGTFRIALEVDGKEADSVDNVRLRLGDPMNLPFDLSQRKARAQAMQQAVESGTVTKEMERSLTPEQKAALEKQAKERTAAMSKNKALNDAFNAGQEAKAAKNWEVAVAQFEKAGEMDATQHVIWGNLAEAYGGLSATKTGDEAQTATDKGLAAFQKAIELKPDDAAYHNNYALGLAKAKRFAEAQSELTKAAQIDAPNAGKYYYNLGAVLVNTGQSEPAGEAFKKAIELDPNYADAQYQYGIYLIGKATTTPDGKIVPPAGTREAFEKYLALRPDGMFADAAKAMLGSIGSTVETNFEKPGSKKQTKKKQ